MSFDDITKLVSQIAFPILCCLIQFWMSYQLQLTHKEETDKMTDALNNNNVLLGRICDKLDIEVK